MVSGEMLRQFKCGLSNVSLEEKLLGWPEGDSFVAKQPRDQNCQVATQTTRGDEDTRTNVAGKGKKCFLMKKEE